MVELAAPTTAVSVLDMLVLYLIVQRSEGVRGNDVLDTDWLPRDSIATSEFSDVRQPRPALNFSQVTLLPESAHPPWITRKWAGSSDVTMRYCSDANNGCNPFVFFPANASSAHTNQLHTSIASQPKRFPAPIQPTSCPFSSPQQPLPPPQPRPPPPQHVFSPRPPQTAPWPLQTSHHGNPVAQLS